MILKLVTENQIFESIYVPNRAHSTQGGRHQADLRLAPAPRVSVPSTPRVLRHLNTLSSNFKCVSDLKYSSADEQIKNSVITIYFLHAASPKTDQGF